MTNDINNAIARSISHNEIVAVEVANPDQARRQTPGVEGWTQLDDGAIDMWGEDVDGEEWRLRVKLDADAAIAAHFDGWGDATNAPAGFAAFAWDQLDETRNALADGSGDQWEPAGQRGGLLGRARWSDRHRSAGGGMAGVEPRRAYRGGRPGNRAARRVSRA